VKSSKFRVQSSRYFFFAMLILFMFAGSLSAADKNETQIKKQPEIQQVKPRKPVKIKLHRTVKGEYTWDLSGDSVDEVVKTDKRLKTLLKIEDTQ
jgi:hypothetical protein